LYALLHSLIDQPELLATIVFSRAITLAGDLLFYLCAVILPDRLVPGAR
jgi:hypothetical protein